MNVNLNFERERELTLLRNQVAQLLTRNLELQQRITELEREKAEVAVETMAAAIIRSVHTAQEAIAAEAPSQPYIVSQLQATLRGLVNVQGENLVLSLPHAEQPIDPNQLSSIQLTISQIPITPARDSRLFFQEALESTQAAFSAWHQEPGVAVAQDITAQLTHLLAIRQQWEGEELVRSVQTLANTLANFADVLSQQISSELLTAYRSNVQEILNIVPLMLQARRATSANLAQLANVLNQLTQSYVAMLRSRAAG